MNKVYTEYMNMLCALYDDVASAYPALTVKERALDRKTIVDRFNCEGVSFLTKTLPLYGKAIDFALSTGAALEIPSFAKRKDSTSPRFLGWLVDAVFDADGVELDTSNPNALVHLRQILYLFYKLEMPYADELVQKVLKEFVSTDSALGMGWNISDPALKTQLQYARYLICRVLGGLCPRNIVPKHGPGSVASGEKLDGKAYFKVDYVNATDFYPLDSHYYFNSSHVETCLRDTELKVRDARGQLHPWQTLRESTAKVVLVPKDSRGPRLISMEPLEIQWLQQGQCECLVRHLESHWLTRDHLNFSNQEVNRLLAWYGSLSGHPEIDHVISFSGETFSSSRYDYRATGVPQSWAPITSVALSQPPPNADIPRVSAGFEPRRDMNVVTLDMKEASDRISVLHVAYLFPNNWGEALMATRSSKTKLPDGQVIELNKFAPMGSAVCFPVEALVFWALSLAAIRFTNPEFNTSNEGKKLLSRLKARVWVYGDDIICHGEDYPAVKQLLEATGLLLNANKCCTAGSFRESCGADVYKGILVTPLRIKQPVDRRWSGQSVMAYVSYSNEAFRRGYTNLAKRIENLLSRDVTIPFTTVDCGFVQFVRPEADVRTLNKQHNVRVRFNPENYELEAYGPTPLAVTVSDRNVTFESYLSRVLSSERPSTIAPTDPGNENLITKKFVVGKPRADQYSLPRRVSSKRGWKRITL